MQVNKLKCGARFSSTTAAVVRRLGLALAIAVMMVSVAPSSAEAGWFKKITHFVSRATNPNGLNRFVSRATNPNGLNRFVNRATNTHGLEHFTKTNIAGLERWAKRATNTNDLERLLKRLCPAEPVSGSNPGSNPPPSYDVPSRCKVQVNFAGSSGQ